MSTYGLLDYSILTVDPGGGRSDLAAAGLTLAATDQVTAAAAGQTWPLPV